MSLPQPRSLIASLLSGIPTPSIPQTSSNPLKDVPSPTKSLLLTLHVLFPNELLPALDLLDRQLVTRFRVKDDENVSEDLPGQLHPGDKATTNIYFVRSAQLSSNPRFSAPSTSHYEVRPLAWNCSCPAFTFSAFPADVQSSPQSPPSEPTSGGCEKWKFGGLSIGPGVCKHLLACVLVERCPGLFAGFVEDRDVTKEELAGWCAGWGG